MWQRCLLTLCFVPICLSAQSTHLSVKEQGLLQGASVKSAKEAFLVRQLLESIEAKDVRLQAEQLTIFLENFPDSSLADPVKFLIGEQALRDEYYDLAKQSYRSLATQEWQQRAQKNYMYASYMTDDWNTLFALEISPLQEMSQEELAWSAEGYFKAYRASVDQEASLCMARQAIARYRLLLQSPYHEVAALALAHLCTQTQEFRQAAHAYTLLAQASPKQAPTYLFQQACMTAHFDTELALERFYDLALEPGPIGDLALLEWTSLAYRAGLAKELITHKELLFARIPQEYHGQLHLCLGNSFLTLQDWESSCDEVIEYLQTTTQPSTLAKVALLSTMEGAFENQLWTLVEVAYTHLEQAFPNDEALKQAQSLRDDAIAAQNTQAEGFSFEEEGSEGCS